MGRATSQESFVSAAIGDRYRYRLKKTTIGDAGPGMPPQRSMDALFKARGIGVGLRSISLSMLVT
ncbi:hypothetical protein ACFL2Q_20190 [Thermodesulfobacteriota bacterium]